MNTRFNKARYAELKKESEEAQPGSALKRRHLKKGGDLDKSSASPIVPKVLETLLPSPTISIEELSPPLRSSNDKDKVKFVSSFWDDPRLAVAKAYDGISMDELKQLSSIDSHDLVT